MYPISTGFPLLLAIYFSNVSISPLLVNYFPINQHFQLSILII